MDKKPLESKKFVTGIIGMGMVMLAGALAVGAGPAGIAVLPYVIGGIVGLAGSQMVTQGAGDIVKTIKNKDGECK